LSDFQFSPTLWPWKEVKQMFRDPNEDGVNESQPPGSIPDCDDYEDDIPFGDLEPGIAEANLAILSVSQLAEDDGS
jgi:hypothetical protein